jgi:hypothetical protein
MTPREYLHDTVLPEVIAATNLHSAGSFSPAAFEAIVRHAEKRTIHHSAETGSGGSTILFSHLSHHHLVFSIDADSGSLVNVRSSPFLRPNVVEFIEGRTQLTLPTYRIMDKLQLVLIDGPHGYPFPDLEYYYLYPHLEPGALLIIDDIQIKTIHNMFEFLRSDAMYRLDEVVSNTAFFTRTDAPTFCAIGDSWWEQRYNQSPITEPQVPTPK